MPSCACVCPLTLNDIVVIAGLLQFRLVDELYFYMGEIHLIFISVSGILCIVGHLLLSLALNDVMPLKKMSIQTRAFSELVATTQERR